MQKIYNSDMQLIGYSVQNESGGITVYDSDYRIRGYYNPRSDKTYDKDMRLVGKGNTTTNFLTLQKPSQP